MRKTSRQRAADGINVRIAVRTWLAKHGPWHSELPADVTRHELDAELNRLVNLGVLRPFAWEVDGHRYELHSLPDSHVVATRIYLQGERWTSYVSTW